MLPDCSGFDICTAFKSESRRAHIPVIMVTALNSPDDKIKGLEAGANDFLSKPVDKHELLLKIKNQLTLLEQYNIIKAQKEEIDQYIRIMVHDLKNPLSVVGGYAELIESFTDDERLRKYTSKIQSSAQDMLNKINDILAVRRK
jgi:two-component system sensor histidine kinase/response regulator